jgi:hypothetical protein
LTPLEQRDARLRQEGWEAAQRAAALDPQSQYAFVYMAVLVPEDQPLERERLIRHAVELTDAGDGTPFLSGFPQQILGMGLMQSGRFRDALPYLQRGADQDRSSGRSRFRLALVHYLMGDRSTGDAAFQRGLAVPNQGNRSVQFLRANLFGDWAGAAALVDARSPEEQAIYTEAYAALASHDPHRIAAAGAVLENLPIDSGRESTIVPLLASLGRPDAVFAALDHSIRIGGAYAAPFAMPGSGNPFVFDPRLRAIRRDPRFLPYLRRARFIQYWRATSSRPDECAESAQPPYCAAIR